MKKLLLTILGPFLLVAGATVGIIWWDRGAPPGFRPTVHDVTVAELTRDHRGVRVKGTGHYELRIRQTDSESGRVWHLYPLFPLGDTMGREISVLVRTRREPDRLAGYADVTVEGLARPPGHIVPRSIIEALLEKGYHFTSDYVLIEEFDDDE